MIRIAAIVALLATGGCQIIPQDGPVTADIERGADVIVSRSSPLTSYAVVDLTGEVVEVANKLTVGRNPVFAAPYLRRPATRGDVRVGVGDIVAVTIFEAQAGGLFIPQEAGSRSGNFVQVPNQQVDGNGNISVPYAGTVKVGGRTTRDVGEEIAQRLRNRAIEPQAVVSVVERRGNDISVLGDVNQPARFSLDPGGLTLLGALARAGGPKSAAYETVVTIQRGGRTTQALLSTIARDPTQNVILFPGDAVFVSREQRIFLVLGSTPSPGSIGGINNRRFPFDNDNVTLAEAVARAGGLDNLRAEAGAVYLFRYEPRDVLATLGVDVSRYPDGLVPTIYKCDWSKADGLFIASNLFMRNKDIIFVSEHPAADFAKFAAILRGATGLASDVSLVTAR